MGIDIGKTDDEWTRFSRELAPPLAAFVLTALELHDRLTKRRTQVVAYVVASAFLKVAHATPLSLSGVQLGVNTAADGHLYGELVDDGGGVSFTLNLYKATGRGAGDKVATGSAAPDAAITLAAANDSGMTGTYQLPASVTATADDTLRFWVCQDFPEMAAQVWDGTVDKDPYSRNAFEDSLAALAPVMLADFLGQAVTFFQRFFITDGEANPTPRGNSFLSGGQLSLLDLRPNDDGDGNQTVTRAGAWERLRGAMEAETTGSTQFVAKRTVSAAAGSFPTANAGKGTIAGHTPLEHVLAGRVVGICTAGVDTDNFGEETFDLTYHYDDADRPPTPLGQIRVNRNWSHPNGLGGTAGMKILRTFTKTNDGSNNILSSAGATSVVNENNANTSSGDLYVNVVADGANWAIEFHKAADRSSSTLVAKATGVTNGATFSATPQNQSNLTVNGVAGGSLSAVSNVILHCNGFKAQNSSGIPDEFEVQVSVTTKGDWQTLLALVKFLGDVGARLHSTTSGSETFQEGLVRQSTFFPFAVKDN